MSRNHTTSTSSNGHTTIVKGMISSKHSIDRRTKLWTIKWLFLCLIVIAMIACNLIVIFVDLKTTSNDEYSIILEQQFHRNFYHNDDHEKVVTDVATDVVTGGSNNGDSAPNESKVSSKEKHALHVNCSTVDEMCIHQIASTIARPFPIRSDKRSWCRSSTDDDDDAGDSDIQSTNVDDEQESGIILIKVTKAASSTSAGVAIRIARRHNCSNVQWKHRFANVVRYIPNKSFLFTTVREPASRAVSTIFFHMFSRAKHVKITDGIVIQQLRSITHNHFGATSNGQGGFQLRYTSFANIPENTAWEPSHPDQVANITSIIDLVQQTISTYDFIIIPERMDESLVVMALLLNIDVGDVLVTSSKVAGAIQYSLLHPNRTTYQCISTTKSFITPVVSQYLQSNEWRAMNYGDYLLYETAQQSLDLTIRNVIGYDRFNTALQRYRTLQQLEQQYCAPNVQFPCSNDGIPQLKIAKENCYLFYYDFGCGYPCIDHYIHQYDSGQLQTDSS